MVKELEGNDVDLEKRVFYRLQAGASLPRFVRNVGSLGYSGLEGLVGVVGSIGGALRMNAGTRHGEMGARVLSIDAINRAGQKRTFLRKKLRFDYRHLDLDKNWILLEAVVYLEKRPAQEVKAKIKEILDYRQKTQPLNLPNAGSIFKNPKEIAAGKVIEKLGLKGTRLRGAKVSELHGNWVVNLGNATAQDILQLIALIKDRVQEKEDLLLETEIQIFGERS
jgi:UDP-N-acetylmuramate dehydrogenase